MNKHLRFHEKLPRNAVGLTKYIHAGTLLPRLKNIALALDCQSATSWFRWNSVESDNPSVFTDISVKRFHDYLIYFFTADTFFFS